MGLPAKLLGADEHVVIHTRTHAKALILPALALILIGGGVGAGAALMPADARPVGTLAVIAVGLVLVLWLVLVPYLRWRTTTYTITNRRLITRSGILNKTGTDLPLNRVHEVSTERSLLDRILGCGTLQHLYRRRGRDGGAGGCARRRSRAHRDQRAAVRDRIAWSAPGAGMTVRVERPAPHVAELVMDRPEALNALSTDQAGRLRDAVREVAAEPGGQCAGVGQRAAPGLLCGGRPQGTGRVRRRPAAGPA